MTCEQQIAIAMSCRGFMVGEEAVTLDIIPLLRAMSDMGRLEDTMYLSMFAMEEAKHIDFFRHWFDAVGFDVETGGMSGYGGGDQQIDPFVVTAARDEPARQRSVAEADPRCDAALQPPDRSGLRDRRLPAVRLSSSKRSAATSSRRSARASR